MNRAIRVVLMLSSFACVSTGCGEEQAAAGDLVIEQLPNVEPSLPAVPTLPPPPHPVQYSDSSYSVYGVRHRIRNTADTDVHVTGFIVGIYEPPECPEGDRCPPAAAPHMWIGDTPQEDDPLKRLTVVGYAENHAQIEEAIEDARAGREREPIPGLPPIPTDFGVGAKVKVNGRFTRMSGTGFNISEGLLEYRGHETLEPAPGMETEEGS
jgi:hypothetical protein